MSRRGKTGLSREEARLWQHVVRDAHPLPERMRLKGSAATTLSDDAAKDDGDSSSQKQAPAKKLSNPPPRKVSRAPSSTRSELSHGAVAGLDRRSAERMRRGKMPIDARLDLHGLGQLDAHSQLDSFLARAHAQGLRCVLVITGKGRFSEEGGVLRKQVPKWLNLPANRERVLAFDYARPQHGGSGALYILLRRQRENRESRR
ncbi:MAG: Smr/MutS family protein [Pseudomonadota bacterium]|uniref:Smr/MutS family protein n=1 Tax=Fodinicurvata fenggangensis TaxID=1121830 RepID=UPI0004796155|nr:Smr/MutS family protein [Fodinicurvata fenggangensis]